MNVIHFSPAAFGQVRLAFGGAVGVSDDPEWVVIRQLPLRLGAEKVVIGEDSGMEVPQEVNPRSTGKSVESARKDGADKASDVFWDAHWTLDDDDHESDSALVLL